jgi:LEA14-like dessication related protein
MRKFLLIILTVLFLFACKTPAPPPQIVQNIEVIEPVEVIEPLFEIISIVILQADLVNTQFETVLKIDNPNGFPVELSTLKYELFGNGLFWADGIENDILRVPAKSSLETKFNFSMNFINMNRKLLDDIIAMRQVQYRFSGDALVRVNTPGAQIFTMDYNCTGLSEVKQKS